MQRVILGIGIAAVSMAVLASRDAPYAGQQAREIKSLSKQEISDYLDGKGMGYAKVAELNHYPGPRHVLDLAHELDLSEAQIARSQEIYDAMNAQAIALGRQLVDKERQLDRKFSAATITPESLRTLTEEIGSLQAKIRYTHLRAHLDEVAALNPQQVRRYDQLRGYGSTDGGEHRHSH